MVVGWWWWRFMWCLCGLGGGGLCGGCVDGGCGGDGV